MSDRRAQRKKELEEKRARLQAIKAAKKAAVSSPVVEAEDSTKQKNLEEINQLKGANNVDDLLSALELPQAKKEEKEESKEEISPAPSSNTPVITKNAPPLILQQRLAEFDVPPKIIPTYEKATQTVSLQTDDDENDIDIPLIKETLPTSSPIAPTVPSTAQKEEKAVQHEELSEIEIQRMLYSQELAEFLDDATRVTERALLINNKFDVLANYKGELGENEMASDKKIHLQNTFKDDKWSSGRCVTSMNWSPKFPELFLTSYSERSSAGQEADGVVLVWTIDNLLDKPEFIFNCQSQVLTAQFPTFQPSIVIGGTYSGQIVLWDTRAKRTPVQSSPLSKHGHTHPIYCIDVVGTQNAHNLVSVSTDGKLCAWSLNNLSQPIETQQFESLDGKTKKAPAATCISFEQGQVNQFYVGTEEGAIYHGSRHGSSHGLTERFNRAPYKKDLDFEVDEVDVDLAFAGHCAPVTGLHFHSSDGLVDFSPYFLTSSLDWSVKLWNKRLLDRPVRSFQSGSSCVYDVKWSPAHPSIFSTADGDGTLNFWNLASDIEVPFLQEKVSSHPLNKMEWSNDSKKLLVGGSDGSVFLYDVGDMCHIEDKEEWGVVEDAFTNLPKPTSSRSM